MAGFEFRFVAMGIGDCTIIKCPDGKIVIVDCGTSGAGQFNDPKPHIDAARVWIQKSCNSVHAIVLSHSDKDHYNRFFDLLWVSENSKYIPVKSVYFSCPKKEGETTPLASYGFLGLCIAFKDFETKTASLVYLSDKKKKIKKYDIKNSDGQTIDEESTDIKSNPPKVNIAIGRDKGKDKNIYDWSLDIIAGNVGESEGIINEGERVNSNSLVVLATYDKKKVLLMADATAETQEYLLKSKFKSELSDLELMNAPHHGSRKNYNQKFYDNVNSLQAFVISSEYLGVLHRLPNYKKAMENWVNKAKAKTNNSHYTQYWDPDPKTKVEDLESLIKKWNQLPLEPKDEGDVRLFIKQSEDLQGIWPPDDEDRVIIKIKDQQGYVMSHYENDKCVLQTSQGSILIHLTHEGIQDIKFYRDGRETQLDFKRN